MPYSKLILKLIDKINSMNLQIDIIAPDHGPIYRSSKNIEWILNMYSSWASKKTISNTAVIVYDTMWQSTDIMARAIAEGIELTGATVALYPLQSSHRSDVAVALLEAGALIVGSPTLNNNMFPTVADLLTYIKGLNPTKLIGAVFGSYGWSGEATNQIKQILENMEVKLISEPIKIKYVPKNEDLLSCRQLGRSIGMQLNKSVY